MEKTSMEMDMEEWEFLPDSKSFLDFSHEGGKELFSKEISFDTKGIVDMNYFICPSPTSRFIHAEDQENLNPASGIEQARRPTDPEPIIIEKKKLDDELAKEFKDIGIVPPTIIANHDAVSQVFFKVKENEFVDMKMNSPKSGIFFPHIEPEPIRFDEAEEEKEQEDCKVEETESKMSKNPAFEKAVERDKDHDQVVKGNKPCLEGFGFHMWRWRSAGIGALCSLGAAAATLCIFVLGGRQRQKQLHQNQSIQFQIYADDKRIKHMMQQATRLNQALSVVREAPIPRAHNVARISFGGYYDGL